MSSIDEVLRQLQLIAQSMGGMECQINMELNAQPIDSLIEKISTREGEKIFLDDVQIENGVFTYKGHHVLLFIPDHSFKFEDKIKGEIEGNKYHLTDCQTLSKMANKGRGNRYQATNNTEGIFSIYGKDINGFDRQAEVELYVCKNCLDKLNYQNYRNNRKQVYHNFSLEEFFSKYSSSISHRPKNVNQGKAGYAENWNEISQRIREENHWRCSECRVDLNQYRGLLQVHHKDGVKQNNSPDNLVALCIECHSKQPHHNHMKVSDNDYSRLWSLRKEQGLR